MVCSKAQPQVKALFAQCDKLVFPPQNNMKVLANFLDGQANNVAIEMLNLSMEGKSTLTF
jgi:hypothetical protein